ncbi:cupin [Vibrio coralliilyticus]|uniref:cupin domain-containing protein n=2 Tax=Vibrio coralliilyticus TaxID=190893 RepID=UPI000BAAD699|nr:cupin domain-containing protein [Vibrio coralliilyticus]AXN33295.1 cupin domain-containing protein [Vibrio coralliilyticus]NOI60907.1 cupin domain-containing protein [Vibrio coralliilyticus]PAT69001.1 cupin [Vibrio coralliilyticus]
MMKKLLVAACLVATFSSQALASEEPSLSDKLAPKVEQLAKSTLSWEGTELPAYGKGTPEITVLKITIPAKAQLPLHEHPAINAGVLTKGQLTVITQDKVAGKKELKMKAGDSLIEVVNTCHYGRNEGDEPAEIIVFYAGTKDQVVTTPSKRCV